MTSPATGRFAPSPSGNLHLGNLRTAALAWLVTRSAGGRFLLRIEDLDAERSRNEYAAAQIDDLHAIGLTWDGEVLRQSDRRNAYRAALVQLVDGGHTYECYCSRKEIRQAQSAPHADAGRYPGTCRRLTDAQRAARRGSGRPATIRLRGADAKRGWTDLVLGARTGLVDDVVLQRWDGAIAYNLAVVTDDLWQGVEVVVRGNDLVGATPTQILLAELLGGTPPRYGHVPLVVNEHGRRLAKRDGAVTLAELADRGIEAPEVTRRLLASLGAAVTVHSGSLAHALDGFDLAALPRQPWVFREVDW